MTIHPFLAHPQQRRPLLMLLVALMILIGAILFRLNRSTLEKVTQVPAMAATSVAIAPASLAAVQQYELKLQRNPDDVESYAGLGLSLLQQVRETGDTTLYARAQKALDEAIRRDPKLVDGLIGQGMLAMSLHNFAAGLEWADKAWTINPYKAEILGIKVDGLVEQGRYEEAVTTLQQMVDLRPDTGSYSRISYLRELNGDVEGSIEAMSMAVKSTPVGTESWLWSLTHLGHLYFNKGDLTTAEKIYQQVLQSRGDYTYALAGIARVQGAKGETEQAIATLKPVAERLPLPEFLTLLGDLYQVAGDGKAAAQQYDLVNVIQQLNAGAGMNVDLEMALFNANHSNDPVATLAQARSAYKVRPTIYGADALAWALYKANQLDEASRYSQEALKLGTQDAMLYFHAGMIAAAQGDHDLAKNQLQKALQINPYFSLFDGQVAKQTLETLK
ncbi:MAG: tetratricopeptide repeat protein [Caldilineaceae bacterium]